LAIEKVLIEVAGSVDLKSTIDQLETIGKVDKANADQFKKSTEAAKKSAEETKKANDNTNKALKEQDGIINRLKSNIQKLTEMRDKSNNPKLLDLYNQKIDAANSKLKNLTTTQKESVKQLSLYDKALQNIGPVLAGAFAVSNVINIGKQILDVTAKFQKFEAVLTNTLGSNSEAQKSIKMITKLAAETPFGVDELVGSYVKLVNQGFKPTAKEITKLGDLAASQGKSFDQLTEAIIDAQTGEFERLKEFGIRASKEGDKVRFTFKGVQTQTDFTSESIRKYILGLGDLKGVSGGMAAISKTLGGQLSNLSDAFDSLLLTVGTKLQGAFAAGIGAISNGVTVLKDLIADTAQESSIFSGVMDVVKMTISNLLAPLKEMFNVLNDVYETVFKPIGRFLSAVFVPIIHAFQKALGGAGTSVGELLAKFNPLIISLRISLIPLQLLAQALGYVAGIIEEHLGPAFQSFTIFLAETRNGIADFINAIIDSGFAKKVQSTLGFQIAKIGKVNIDELRKSFSTLKDTSKEATTEAEKSNEATKKQIVTIESLTEKVKKLTEERDKADVTDLKKINSLNAEIKKTEDLIKKLKGQDDATKEAIKNRKAYEEMQKRAQATLTFDPILNPDLTKDSAKKVHDERLKSMKAGQKIIQQEIKNQQEADKKILEGIQKREAAIKQAKQIGVDFAFNTTDAVLNFVEESEARKAESQIAGINATAEAEILALDKRLAKGRI
jgi:hypothetical protein